MKSLMIFTLLGILGALAPGTSFSAIRNISISNFEFVPAGSSIFAGDTVIWTNQDQIEHTSTSDAGVWNSGLLSQNESFTFVFASQGTFPYHCTPHPFMRDTIVVVPSVGIEEVSAQVPGEFELFQNQPNPFNSRTLIAFSLGARGRAVLEVFDILGNRVGELMSGELEPGAYSFAWDAGERPSGIFFYRLTFNGETRTDRMTLIK